MAGAQQEKHREDERREGGKICKGKMMQGPREQGKDSGFYLKGNVSCSLERITVAPFLWKNSHFFF